MNSAGCFARSMALRTSAMRVVTPVEVSLCTAITALICLPLSSSSFASTCAGSTPWRQSPGTNTGSRARRFAMLSHSVAKCPVSNISTRSPGESVFTSAASHAPVPEAGKITTGEVVLNTCLRPASTSLLISWNSGPRWSTVAPSIARSTRSGTLVGPGICRKWRPLWCFMGRLRGSVRYYRTEVRSGMRKIDPGDSALAARLKREVSGDVLFDAASRGRYSTDASIYQIEPVGVVVPRTEEDALAAFRVAVDEGVPVLARGGGTSQCGQTVGAALVIDHSKYLDRIVGFDPAARTVAVQPGVVLDHLNAFLKPHGLWYPVDVSTSAQATIGGMAGNNSCGSRSIRYGNMVHNVRAIDAVLPDGSEYAFGEVLEDASGVEGPAGYKELARKIRAIAAREAEEIEHRGTKLLRRVGGYNLARMLGGRLNLGDRE